VLCGRNGERLESQKKEIEEAARSAGRNVEVHTFSVDLRDRKNLLDTLAKIQALGPIGCVYHNAARVKPGEALTASPDELEEDFKVR
jgi:short-subunit dehydrogenase